MRKLNNRGLLSALGIRQAAASAPETEQESSLQYNDGVSESPEKAAAVMADWFSRARISISISTGLTIGLLSRQIVREALIGADERGVQVKVLLDRVPNERLLSEGHAWLLELTHGEVRRTSFHVDHWVLVDFDKIRVERSHPLRGERGDHLVRSCFWITGANMSVLQTQKKRFDSVWDGAEIVPRLDVGGHI